MSTLCPSACDQDFACARPSIESAMECAAWFEEVLDAVSPGWIAGGALRDYFSRTPNTSDIDVYFSCQDDLEQATRRIGFTSAELLYDKPHVSGYLLNGRQIEFCKHRFFADPEETITTFDFTVCCAAIDQTGRVIVHPSFFEDLAAKRLILNRIDFPVGTMARLPKYMAKGFTADLGTLLRLAKAMKDVDFDDPDQNKLEFYRGGQRRFGRFANDSFYDDSEAA